ncbi:MAG: hypothetical protein SP4CHLAM17_09610 [Chlamydiales bacterium]|nr:hypothetical protein [Chlamydiales bacterium]
MHSSFARYENLDNCCWAGFYFGAFGGFDWGEHKVRAYRQEGSAFNNAAERFKAYPKGGMGGVLVGYNLQLSWLIPGVEAELGYLSFHGDKASPFGAETDLVSSGGVYGTVTGRLGIACCRWLLYSKGGYAYFIPKLGMEDDTGGTTLIATERKSRNDGWTAGGGVECFLTRCIIGKIEYLYMGFPEIKISGIREVSNVANAEFTWNHKIHVQSVKAGINLKF